METHRSEELAAPEFVQALQRTSLVYVPFGSFEFHGPHLPLGTDTLHVYEFCLRAVKLTGGLVLPPTYWNANGLIGWPGSVMIRESTFETLVLDIFSALAEQNVKLIVASTGHYPEKQGLALSRMAEHFMPEHPRTRILVLDPFAANPNDQKPDHAGKKEVSLMLELRPDLVRMDRLSSSEDFKGINPNAGEGNRAFGAEYFNASLQGFVDTVRAHMAGD